VMRKPNSTPRREPITTRFWLTDAEWAELKPYPSQGGIQSLVKWLLENRQGNAVHLPDPILARVARCIFSYGGGGPNDDLRRAFYRFMGPHRKITEGE
jgi:hypothetical protein